MDNALTRKTDTLPEAAKNASAWDMPSLSQRDIIIPSILLMQPMSPQVTDGQAKFGEYIESLTGSTLGYMDKGFEFVPFKMVKLFQESIDNGDEENEFLRSIEITPENENLPYQDTEMIDGREEKIIRDRVLKFYVLLKKELEEGATIPYTINFKRSNYKAGQKLATQMFIKNISSGKTPASMVMSISCAKKTEGNKTWVVGDVVPAGVADNKYIADSFRWLEIVNSGKAKEHEPEKAAQPSPSQGGLTAEPTIPSDDIPF